MPRLGLPVLVLFAALQACAPRVAVVSPSAALAPPVRGEVPPGLASVVWGRAVELLEARGYRLEVCDGERSALRTARLELEAPCGGTTCLARQSVTVKVGLRAVRLSVRREVWDAAARGWTEVDDARGVADVVREEQRLLGELLTRVDRWNFLPARRDAAACRLAAPCGPGECNYSGLAMN